MGLRMEISGILLLDNASSLCYESPEGEFHRPDEICIKGGLTYEEVGIDRCSDRVAGPYGRHLYGPGLCLFWWLR